MTAPAQHRWSKKLKVAIGIGAAVLAAAAIGAGTYAAFVDVENGPASSVGAGTLDLAVGGTALTNLFDGTNIQPGYDHTVTLSLTNSGSIPGTLSDAVTLTGSDITCTEPESAAEGRPEGECNPLGDLQDQMLVSIDDGPDGAEPTSPVTLTQFAQTGFPSLELQAGEVVTYTLHFTLPNLAGTQNNAVQGDGVSLTSSFTLDQLTP